MKECKKCGTRFEGSAQFCPSCGSLEVAEVSEEIQVTLPDEIENEPKPAVEETPAPVKEEVVAPPQEPNRKPNHHLVTKGEDLYERKNRFALLSSRDVFWSWFLMEIPLVGWLVAIAWSFGLGIKEQRKQMARAFLLRLLVGIVLVALAIVIYRFIFRYTLNDLPSLIGGAYDKIWNYFARLLSKQGTAV